MNTKDKKREKKAQKAESSAKDKVSVSDSLGSVEKTKKTKRLGAVGDSPKYDKFWLTTDVAVYTIIERKLHVLLIQRQSPPFADCWALPGGFLKLDEPLETAAKRELRDECGLELAYLEQFRTYSRPDRDPRTRVISVALIGLVPADISKPPADNPEHPQWFTVDALPNPLAFDHAEILTDALSMLRERAEQPPIVQTLAPTQFTLTQLQEVYEVLGDRAIDKRNFRKWILESGLVEATGEMERGRYRPAQLYRFVARTPLRQRQTSPE